jgi:hypothetical protein
LLIVAGGIFATIVSFRRWRFYAKDLQH